MAEFNITNDFYTNLTKFEITDQVHAEVFNERFAKLINNDNFLNQNIKFNSYDETRRPIETDDESLGYSTGSIWFSEEDMYICLDATQGGAEWAYVPKQSDLDDTIAQHETDPIVHHDNINDPTTYEKAALSGTEGSPSDTNRYVTDADTRLSDARTPVSHTHPESEISDLQDYILSSEKAATYGVATLDADGKIPAEQMDNVNHMQVHGNDWHSDDFIPAAEKGAGDGLATLDSTGNVPGTQLGNVEGMEMHGDEWHSTVYIHSSEKTAAGGVATLDADSLVPQLQIPLLDLSKIPNTLTGKDADTLDGYHYEDIILKSNSDLTIHTAMADAHHDNINDPTTDEKAALTGTHGSPSETNKYVTGSDPRLTNSRDPNQHIHVESDITDLKSYVETSKLAASNGVATLDGTGNVPSVQLGNVDAMEMHGDEWHSTNYATLDESNNVPVSQLENAHDLNIREDTSKPFFLEVRTSDPTSPDFGRMWIRTDI